METTNYIGNKKKEKKVKNIHDIVKCRNALREAVGLDENGASIFRLSIFR